jgi:hypothetical protein
MKPINRRDNIRSLLAIEDGLRVEDLALLTPYTSYQLKEKTRLRDVLVWRQTIQTYLYSQGLGWTDIARIFSQNHATVMHSVKLAEELITVKDPLFMDVVHKLRMAEARTRINLQVDNIVQSLINLENFAMVKNKLLSL